MLHLKSSHCIKKPMRFSKPHRFNLLKINELPPQYLYQFIVIVYLLSLNISILSAQTTSVKGTKTDKVFANTTEIYKSKAASDAQVLAELESDYGIGDVVRISDAPSTSTTAPLLRTTSIQSEKKPLPSIPKTVNVSDATTSVENISAVNKSINPTKAPLSKQALVITSGLYKSDIEMPEKKTAAKPNTPKTAESTIDKKAKAYTPPLTLLSSSRSGMTVKTSKSAKSYKKSATSNKKFLFFFKKKNSKSSKKAKYKDNNKFGCYKF